MNKEYDNIDAKKYYFDRKLRQIGQETVLGEHAEKVTIVMLSLNRSEHTLLLLQSLIEQCPSYAGKVLIADNGSSEEELEKIKKRQKDFPFEIRVYEFGKNLGVAKGRNRAFALVDTEWIFSLDNDIFFVANPFPRVEKTLLDTGAKFCNLPLLDEEGRNYISNGGHLWINKKEKDVFFVSCGPIFRLERNVGNTKADSALSTYLFGGCAFYHTETFLNTKGFDEEYFVGFEDIDYSLGLYHKGYKIANCCFACLVHNHPKQKLLSSYDRERYRYDVIKKGAEYFQKKNGLQVWDEVTEQFFIEQSLKENEVEPVAASIQKIYEQAKKNYAEVSLCPVPEEDEEDTIARLEQYNAALRQAMNDLTTMNEELRRSDKSLRTYSANQEKAIGELKNMNQELREYSEAQEKMIAALKIQLEELQTQAVNPKKHSRFTFKKKR